MSNSTTFVNQQTVIQAPWCNDVNNAIFSSSAPAGLTAGITKTVSSIAALRTTLKSEGSLVNVTGYYTAGDGGGGNYVLISQTNTGYTDNGGSVIVAVDGGVWVLMQTTPYSVKQFGAKVDGSTDDTSAINATLATGKDAYIPAGTTVISGPLLSSTKQQLFGDGREISIITVNGSGFDAVTLSANYAGVRDLSFTSTAARTGGSYVKFSAATRGNFVQRIKLTNAYYGIWIAANAVVTTMEDVELVNTAPTNGVGVFIDGGNDTFLTRVVMDAPVGSQPLCGVRIKSSQATWMTDCDLIHQGRGIQIDPDNNLGELVTWCFFDHVACDLGTGDGLYVNPSNGATVKGLFFDNCWFSSNLNGVNIIKTGSNAVDGVFFTDCTMFNNQQRGSWNQGASNVEWNNCRIAGNSQASSGTYAGIEIANSTSYWAVRGTRSGAIAGFTSSQSYGLVVGSSCDIYQITDNNFIGNATAAALDNSTGTSGTREVRGNLGYKTITSGIATVANGTSQISVAHGLAGTPSVVLANPTNTNLGGISFWTGTFGASTFNINTGANVSGAALFSWTASLYN